MRVQVLRICASIGLHLEAALPVARLPLRPGRDVRRFECVCATRLSSVMSVSSQIPHRRGPRSAGAAAATFDESLSALGPLLGGLALPRAARAGEACCSRSTDGAQSLHGRTWMIMVPPCLFVRTVTAPPPFLQQSP
eukprot:m.132654 g.132654  ORF g.132654 m.132654 type:complete len:137 (-) comp9836_c0_seq3:1753-2163(-)